MYGVDWLTAAHTGEERCDRLGEEDVARLVVIAGDSRARGHVDSTNDGENRERKGEREIVAYGDRHSGDEAQ